MKFLSFILFSLFYINIVHSVESTDPVDEILGEDVILPNMIQTNMRKFKVKDIQNEILNKVDRREYSCNGYIDLNIMKGSIVSENSSNNNLRFIKKFFIICKKNSDCFARSCHSLRSFCFLHRQQ